ncbi:hypothetical protein GOP47_0023514 [Adiantum capillus-veneris]|uniref:NYN domain-containing protein n=1 Tax=Adiantum capillus-veneris TaxID=13818 RepID=A0A9D4U3J9_ADICA|nr:hypothetical protein GOP47_0023514 [Adiantum capillus-veneris]
MLGACKWAALWRYRQRIHATQFSAASYSKRAGEEREDWRDVGVFWDIENCSIPSNLDPYVVRPNIERALRTSGFLGPIHVAGYANLNTLCRGHTLESLSESGISIHHVPCGGRDASDRALLIDVMFWTMKHSPPAHVLLITGDSDFSVLMHKLRLLGYNVLLAANNGKGVSSALLHAASRIWVWPDIIIGEPEGLIAETHVPGTALPEIFISNKKESGTSKSSMGLHEDLGHEYMRDVFGGTGKVRLLEGGWLPPPVVDRIVNIVKDRPGITLGELMKELKAINFHPKLYGYHDHYHCLSSIDRLEIQFVNGVDLKGGMIFNVLSHAADKRSDEVSARKVNSMSRENSGRKDYSDGKMCNDQPEIEESTGKCSSTNGKSSTKTSLGQKKSVVSDTHGSWGSLILSFFKGASVDTRPSSCYRECAQAERSAA